jgi:hypothetical protein
MELSRSGLEKTAAAGARPVPGLSGRTFHAVAGSDRGSGTAVVKRN